MDGMIDARFKSVRVMRAIETREDELIGNQMPKHLRVLFVEDSDQDADLITCYLQQSGYHLQSEIVCDSMSFTEALGHED